MSKSNLIFIITLPVDKIRNICKKAISEIGWRILNEGNSYYIIKEEVNKMNMMNLVNTNCAKIEVTWSNYNDSTKILLDGSIIGFGPIQSNHLKGQIGRLKNIIEIFAEKEINQITKINYNNLSISEELEKLSQLLEKGIIDNDEFQKAKKKIIDNY